MRLRFAAVVCLLLTASPVLALTPIGDRLGVGPVSAAGIRVAAGANGYFATWQNERYETIGTRLSPQGAPLDAGVLLKSAFAAEYYVVSDGRDYLVVSQAGHEVEATLVDAETGALTPAFRTPGNELFSALWDGTSYVVAIGMAPSQLVLVRLDERGRELSRTAPITQRDRYLSPSLAGSGGVLAAFWRDSVGKPQATVLATHGGEIEIPANLRVMEGADVVVTDGIHYLIAWHDNYNYTGLVARLYDRGLQPDGEFVIGGQNDVLLAVVPRSRGFVAFIRPAATPQNVVAVVIDGGPVRTRPLVADVASFWSLSVAMRGNELLWLYTVPRKLGLKSFVLDTTIDWPLRSASEGTDVAIEPLLPASAAIAGDAHHGYAVAWHGVTSSPSPVIAPPTRLAVRLLDGAGSPAGPQTIIGVGRAPSIAADGNGGYLVGWLDDAITVPSPYNWFVPATARFAHIAAGGAVAPATTLQTASGIQVVWARDHYVVAWQLAAAPHNTVAIRVARDGQPIDLTPVSITEGDYESAGTEYTESPPLLAVTKIGIVFLIPTYAMQTHTGASYVDSLLVSYDLDRMRARERVTPAPATEPHLAANGPLLLTYQADRTTHLIRLSDDGRALDSFGPVVDKSGVEPALSRIGDLWVISWRDRVRYFDDDLAERSSFLLEAPGPLALAPLGTGAMYVQQCPSDSALLCRGTLAVAPSRSQRRAAH